MYVTYTRIYGWSDYGGESSYQPGYRLENMMWMTLLVYDYIIPGKNILQKNFVEFDTVSDKDIVINSDVWIGAGVTVLSGVKIGVGAVVGAGSVVTHDIPPYEIWAGNPAKKIRSRFDEKTTNDLLKTNWWEWNDKKIEEYANLFNDPVKFIEKFKEQ